MRNLVVLMVLVMLAAVAAALFFRLQTPSAPEPPSRPVPPVKVEAPAPAPVPAPVVAPAPQEQTPVAPAAALAAVAAPAGEPPLTAETLRNTTWEHDKFRIDLAADGSVVIGGRDRARWMVEGDRLKLYSPTSDEVHYFDIKGSKLFWEGIEVGRSSKPFQAPAAP